MTVLVDREIKKLTEQGNIISTASLEGRIGACTFEPQITDDVYCLVRDMQGIVRPQRNKTVFRTLSELPKTHYKKLRLPTELRRGYSYLIKLTDKIHLEEDLCVEASPKSSFGRLFLNTRLLTDYNSSYDQILPECIGKRDDLELWLLVQPLAFNIILDEGMALNQLRFERKTREDSLLNNVQLQQEYQKKPLLFLPGKQEKPLLNPVIHRGGLHLHLEATGQYSEGIAALRAIHNPDPLDLRKRECYNPEEYYDFIPGNGKIIVEPKENYLVCSQEIVGVPLHLCCTVSAKAEEGLDAKLHYAGYVHPGYRGGLVLEMTSHEKTPMTLEDGSTLANLNFIRTSSSADYGKQREKYGGQLGPMPPRCFKNPFPRASEYLLSLPDK